MMFYHLSPDPLAILSGPHAADSLYVRGLTRCGTPAVLDLADYDLVPEVKPALGAHQSYGAPIVTAEAVTFPLVDWTAEQIAEQEAQELAASRAALRCTPRQARLALAGAGLLTAVEAFVAASDAAIQIEWEYASEIKRDWPPVMAFAAANEISDEQLDALFALAASL
jgi:hypothetical protein